MIPKLIEDTELLHQKEKDEGNTAQQVIRPKNSRHETVEFLMNLKSLSRDSCVLNSR